MKAVHRISGFAALVVALASTLLIAVPASQNGSDSGDGIGDSIVWDTDGDPEKIHFTVTNETTEIFGGISGTILLKVYNDDVEVDGSPFEIRSEKSKSRTRTCDRIQVCMPAKRPYAWNWTLDFNPGAGGG